jgi:hypothetical protein
MQVHLITRSAKQMPNRRTKIRRDVAFDEAARYTRLLFTDGNQKIRLQINRPDRYQSTAPLPSLDTVRFSLSGTGGLALDLVGYTDATFPVQRSTDLKTWTNWRTGQASELPQAITETSSDDTG